MTKGRQSASEIFKYGLLAGTAGGLAEIAWVSFYYAAISGGNAGTLARGVTTAAGVTALLPAAPVTVGVAVHMMLALLLGVALAYSWQTVSRRGADAKSLYGFMLASLAAVWAINFFIVLPVISASFVHLVPYSVSLMSKLLFGIAAAETLRRCATVQRASAPVFVSSKVRR